MPEKRAESAVEARGLHKTYRRDSTEVHVLKGLDLSVRAGEFVAVTGASGSGKSTLVHLLGLVDEPTRGEVILFGQPSGVMGERDRARLRNRRLGFVFQFDSLLADFTVLENVTMPGRIALGQGLEDGSGLRRMEDRARELLSRFELGALEGRFPLELSGGEKQRAAMARALFNRPDILLADEPTGNLDRHNGELVLSCMKEAADDLGVAVVLVTHNDYAARFASRVLKLYSGTLTASARGEPAG